MSLRVILLATVSSSGGNGDAELSAVMYGMVNRASASGKTMGWSQSITEFDPGRRYLRTLLQRRWIGLWMCKVEVQIGQKRKGFK